jgi:hypothetical protein
MEIRPIYNPISYENQIRICKSYTTYRYPVKAAMGYLLNHLYIHLVEIISHNDLFIVQFCIPNKGNWDPLYSIYTKDTDGSKGDTLSH